MNLLASRVFTLAFCLALAGLLASCQTTQEKNYVTLGNQYAKDGLLREASESYKKALVKTPNSSIAHRNLGMVLVKLGDYRGASRHLEKAMKKYERDFDANYYLGESYRAQDKYAEAIFRYKQALKIKEGDPRALKPLTWSYFKIRYYTEALAHARELQKVAGKDDQTTIILARTLLKLKRSNEALVTVRTARKSMDNNSRAFFNSVEGDILYELGDAKNAEKMYRDALKDQPLLPGALLGLGKVMLDMNKTKLAISYMERAVRIRPRLTEAHYLLAKAYEPTDKEKALKYYQYFRKQASADPEFIAKLNEVKTKIGMLQK